MEDANETNEIPHPREQKEHLDHIVAEIGAHVVRQLHRAFELTAGALYRRTTEKTQAELNGRQEPQAKNRRQRVSV